MPTTQNFNISYSELIEGHQHSVTAGETSVTRLYLVAGADIPLFVRDMVGYSYRAASGALRRILPNADPAYPWLYCTSVNFVEPAGEPSDGGFGNALQFENVKVSCNYQALPYRIATDEVVDANADGELIRFVERKFDFRVESIIVPGRGFIYEGTAVQIPEPPPKLLPTVAHVLRWVGVPAQDPDDPSSFLPTTLISNIRSVQGRVNNGTFLGAAAEELLLDNVEAEPTRGPNGEKLFTVTYSILERSGGDIAGAGATWNKLFRASTQQFQKVVREDDNTKSIYETVDYAKLFQIT